MSNFKCDKCGTDIIDSEKGYITGCIHYPLKTIETEEMIKYICNQCGFEKPCLITIYGDEELGPSCNIFSKTKGEKNGKTKREKENYE
jgi:hypothetical protein